MFIRGLIMISSKAMVALGWTLFVALTLGIATGQL